MKKIHYEATEADIATALGHWFSARGYECYPEMEADLTVYHRGRDELIGIEAKRDLNFKVLHQALQKKRTGRFDAVLVCASGSKVCRFWTPKLCSHPDVALGVVVVSSASRYHSELRGSPGIEILLGAPALVTRDHCRTALIELMCPEAQTYATPGDRGPQGFTPFRMMEVRLYRACIAGPLSIPEALEIAAPRGPKGTKRRLDQKRFLSYFGGAFRALEIKADHVMIRAPWGSLEAGHSGITWAPADPVLAAAPSGVLMDKGMGT